MRRLLATFVVACCCCPPLASQQIESIAAGARVRIQTVESGNRWVVGSMGGLTPTSLWLDGNEIPRGSIRTMEVSDGVRSRLGKGMFRGALVGGAAGLVVGIAHGEVPDEPVTAPLLAGAGAVAGLLVGGIIGALSPGHAWRSVDANRISVGVVPSDRTGVAVRIAASF